MAEPSAKPSSVAEYALESPLICRNCKQELTSIMIVRLLRTRVDFVSTLPRRGHAIACPACQGIITVELGGLT